MIALLALFFLFFGIPSFKKYMENGISISQTNQKIGNKSSPVVTICASDIGLDSIIGWKNNSGDWENLLDIECGKPTSVEETRACIDKKTYNIDDILEIARYGENSISLTEPGIWTSDITMIGTGKCYALTNHYSLGTDLDSSLVFYLKKNMKYLLLISDPTIIVETSNPETVPQNLLYLEPTYGFKRIYIRNKHF